MWLIAALVLVIILIVISSTKFNLHPFLSLLLAALAMGFIAGLDSNTLIGKISEGLRLRVCNTINIK